MHRCDFIATHVISSVLVTSFSCFSRTGTWESWGTFLSCINRSWPCILMSTFTFWLLGGLFHCSFSSVIELYDFRLPFLDFISTTKKLWIILKNLPNIQKSVIEIFKCMIIMSVKPFLYLSRVFMSSSLIVKFINLNYFWKLQR